MSRRLPTVQFYGILQCNTHHRVEELVFYFMAILYLLVLHCLVLVFEDQFAHFTFVPVRHPFHLVGAVRSLPVGSNRNYSSMHFVNK